MSTWDDDSDLGRLAIVDHWEIQARIGLADSRPWMPIDEWFRKVGLTADQQGARTNGGFFSEDGVFSGGGGLLTTPGSSPGSPKPEPGHTTPSTFELDKTTTPTLQQSDPDADEDWV